MASDPLREAIAGIVQEQIAFALGPYKEALERITAFMGPAQPNKVSARLAARMESMSSDELTAIARGEATVPNKRKGRGPSASKKPCAVKDCPRDAKSLGFCLSHYQKYNNLKKSDRLPESWKAVPAAPHSLDNPVLPRGRAAKKSSAKKKK